MAFLLVNAHADLPNFIQRCAANSAPCSCSVHLCLLGQKDLGQDSDHSQGGPSLYSSILSGRSCWQVLLTLLTWL